jgi:hypothetical protein
LTFAHVYAALKELTGESSRLFDDHKGSFSFLFRLNIRKAERELEYLLEVRNHRDSPYFHVRKLVASDDLGLKHRVIHPPFEEKWPSEEINSLIAYLYGYLWAYGSACRKETDESFIHAIRSSLVLYGYCDGEVFEKVYGSSEDWEAAYKDYEEKIQRQRMAVQADPCLICGAKPRTVS